MLQPMSWCQTCMHMLTCGRIVRRSMTIERIFMHQQRKVRAAVLRWVECWIHVWWQIGDNHPKAESYTFNAERNVRMETGWQLEDVSCGQWGKPGTLIWPHYTQEHRLVSYRVCQDCHKVPISVSLGLSRKGIWCAISFKLRWIFEYGRWGT